MITFIRTIGSFIHAALVASGSDDKCPCDQGQGRCSGLARSFALVCLGSLALTGCASRGPATIARDRFDYVASVSDSWKRQTLVNLVKMRYADAPVFLDVVSVINAYSWEADLNVGGQFAKAGLGDQFLSLGAAGRYGDHPTISYEPLTGEKFARSLLAPFPIRGILAIIQSGYRADVVLRACVNRVNGLENSYGSFGNQHSGSVEFYELMEALRTVQAAGRLDMRFVAAQDKEKMIMALRPARDPEGAATNRRIRELLGLDPKATEFDVVQGAFSSSSREIAILPRSMQQVMIDFASYISVPPVDVAEGRVYALSRSDEQLRMYPPPIDVRSGSTPPADAFVTVRYREHWFWIEDRDVRSKAVFSFLQLMFSLTETGEASRAPVLTIPAR